MKTECPDCGYNNLEKSEFCQNCGYDLSKKGDVSKKSDVKTLHEQIEDIDDIIFKPKKKGVSLPKIILIIFSVLGGIFILLVIWYVIFPGDDSSTGSTGQTGTESVSNSQWKTFNSTEYGFKINFPADYNAERIPEEKLDNGVTYSGMQYTSSPNDKEVYLAQVADYDITPSDYDNKLGLEGIANYTAQGSDGNLTNSSFTKLKGFDAIQFAFTTKDNYFGKGVAFIKDDLKNIRMFMMVILSDTSKFENYDTFVNSFDFR